MKLNTILVGIITSMLLLTLPALASDYTLGIFGNANEDDTINMQDVTYTELIILEYRDETELADAKYDGKINMQDVTQIELVILGKEKELTLIDYGGETTTVRKPVESMVVVTDGLAEMTRIVGADDKVIGVDTMVREKPVYFPDLSGKPSVGKRFDLDIEAILTLNPDLVLLGRRGWYTPGLEDHLEGTGIDIVRLGAWGPGGGLDTVATLGYLFGSDEAEAAREYQEWYDEYADMLDEKVSGLSEDERTTVFLSSLHGGTPPSGHLNIFVGGSVPEVSLEMAGGKNIARDLMDVEGYISVETEWIMEQDPEVIIAECWQGGYETDDSGKMKEVYDNMMDMPALQQVKAVKENRVYVTRFLWAAHPIMALYMAKWLYPDIFEDLDPQAVHQEYIDTFQGVDFDVGEHGVFMYPPSEAS